MNDSANTNVFLKFLATAITVWATYATAANLCRNDFSDLALNNIKPNKDKDNNKDTQLTELLDASKLVIRLLAKNTMAAQ